MSRAKTQPLKTQPLTNPHWALHQTAPAAVELAPPSPRRRDAFTPIVTASPPAVADRMLNVVAAAGGARCR